MTVATEKTDAFLRYIRSAEINKLKGKVKRIIVMNMFYKQLYIGIIDLRLCILFLHYLHRSVTGSWYGR